MSLPPLSSVYCRVGLREDPDHLLATCSRQRVVPHLTFWKRKSYWQVTYQLLSDAGCGRAVLGHAACHPANRRQPGRHRPKHTANRWSHTGQC